MLSFFKRLFRRGRHRRHSHTGVYEVMADDMIKRQMAMITIENDELLVPYIIPKYCYEYWVKDKVRKIAISTIDSVQYHLKPKSLKHWIAIVYIEVAKEQIPVFLDTEYEPDRKFATRAKEKIENLLKEYRLTIQ